MSELFGISIAVTAVLTYAFIGGVVYELLTPDDGRLNAAEDTARFVGSSCWPVMLIALIVYGAVHYPIGLGAAAPRFIVSLIRRPKIPAAIIHRER